MDAPRPETTKATGCPGAGETMRLQGGESRVDPQIRNDPFPFYRALREQKPVYYDPKIDTWLVTHRAGASRVRPVSVNRSATSKQRVEWEIETSILRG